MNKKMDGGAAVGSSGYSNSFSSVFDYSEEAQKGSLLGFMELLGSQDYYSGSTPLLDSPQMCVAHDDGGDGDGDGDDDDGPAKAAGNKECCEVQQPPTPNSSSISSASSEALHHQHNKTTAHQPPHHQKTSKQLKAKKTNQKRQKEPRFAFMTKSEVDHLEDGYRWRKYGQKAVKNSPFPRSYYRCTSASCNVKKRVERSFNDPSVVVTTYEGQHTHPSPVLARSSCLAGSPVPHGGISATPTAAGFGSLVPENYLSQYYQRQHNQQLLFNTLSSLGFPSSVSQERSQLCNPAETNALILRDHGLLQDVVPSHMLKEE